MRAADVMITDVITVSENATVQSVAQLMVEKRISGLPVIDRDNRVIGIVSEGDLLRRVEIGTQRRRSWWLELFVGTATMANDYVKANAKHVSDIMTRAVVTASEDTPLGEIATILERNQIKRVPIVRDDRLVGIVSRANLVQAIATFAPAATVSSNDDWSIRERLVEHIRNQPWGMPWLANVTVQNGVATLWGPVPSDQIRTSVRVAAERTPGVEDVRDELFVWDPTMDYYPPMREEAAPQKLAS